MASRLDIEHRISEVDERITAAKTELKRLEEMKRTRIVRLADDDRRKTALNVEEDNHARTASRQI